MFTSDIVVLLCGLNENYDALRGSGPVDSNQCIQPLMPQIDVKTQCTQKCKKVMHKSTTSPALEII